MKGRPQENEYQPYFGKYIDKVDDKGFMAALKSPLLLDLISELTEEQWSFSYASEKWNIKEVLVHLMDTERIFCYRALRIARNDKTALNGFEQDDYVPYYGVAARSSNSLIEEYKAVRQASIAFFSNLVEADYLRIGIASDHPTSVRALAFMIAGHEIHHYDILIEKYLV